MNSDLYCMARADEGLTKFVRRVADSLALRELEHRSSTNYVGGEYFILRGLCINVTIAYSDHPDLTHWRFWLFLNLDDDVIQSEGSTVLEGISDLVARRLTLSGETVMRLENAGAVEGERRIGYVLDGHSPNVDVDEIAIVTPVHLRNV